MGSHNHDNMEHMHHAHSHHGMDISTEASSAFTTVPATTAATLLQAVMTTVMSHGNPDHHRHHMVGSHSGHSMDVVDQVPHDSSHLADVHATHVSSGEHMPMYFHFGIDSIILFKEWSTSTTEGLIGSLIGIFILAMLYEGLKFFREFLFKKYFTSLEYSSVAVLGDDGKPVTEVHKVARNRMFSWPHALQTCLHIIQMILSYFLMLIFMTYNVWLCLAVVGGAGMGYFLFGWRKATVVDITEHCH